MPTSSDQAQIAGGDLASATSGIASFSRSLWNLAFVKPPANQPVQHRSQFLTVSLRDLNESLKEESPDSHLPTSDRLLDQILEALVAGNWASITTDSVRVVKTACHPLRLMRDLLGGSFPDYQLQWQLMLAIRKHYRCVPSAQVAHLFHFLAEELNRKMALTMKLQSVSARRLLFAKIHPFLISRLVDARIDPTFAPDALALFLETCRAINYVQVDYNPGEIAAMTTSIDAEYLLSRLFGLSTSISGFDDLFGGGILLPDKFVAKPNEWSQNPIVGRTVLTVGRYATGKSSLALQMAVEVAKKGGAAWFMPFEQSADECLYSLETMSALPADGSVSIAQDVFKLEHHLANQSPDRGLLILLRNVKDSLDSLLDLLPGYAQQLQNFPLRMLFLDPLNSLVRLEKNVNEERRRVLKVLEEVKNTGTNVWMNAEEGPGGEPDRFFEQNIADTAIRLSVAEELGYSQTYMEVTKSRLQRQQRGRNPYTIQSGRGLVVSASSVSFADRIRARRFRVGTRRQSFGIPDFNKIIGPDLIRSGDVIALVGPGGTFKTQVGLMFLHATGRTSRKKAGAGAEKQNQQQIRNLLIPARDTNAEIEAKLGGNLLQNQLRSFTRWGEVRICSVPSALVRPGEILQRIESEFLDARLTHCAVERVMVDNVPHWEMACPFIRGDESFPDTLLNLFRGRGCTTLLTCNPVGVGSDLQKTIIDSADCVIEFDSIQARGATRILVRVIKTRTMRHRRETFELVLRAGSIELSPDAQLLRISANKEVSTVKVRLFLHSENAIQRQYNQEIRSTIRSTLAPEVALDNQSRLDLKRLPGLGAVSSVDELQLLQLDEFEVRGLRDETGTPLLYRFHNSDWDSQSWSDFKPRLVSGVRAKGGGFIAVPFCENISVLAYHVDRLQGPIKAESWQGLAAQIAELEGAGEGIGEEHSRPVIFDFAEVTGENFNCLFFEMLQSMLPAPAAQDACALQSWLRSKEAFQAVLLMRRIGGRSYAKRCRERLGVEPTTRSTLNIELNPSATIWRTWYSTLMQMLRYLSPEEVAKIRVIPLPGDVTVAGEWFLGIPAHSAAPDVGLRLIRNLTTREAELDRMKRGVGLPTRLGLYGATPSEAPISESFRLRSLDFYRITENPFRRSRFDCYRDFSDILSTHLKAIMDLQTEDTGEIHRILNSAISRVSILQSGAVCSDCGKLETIAPLQPTAKADPKMTLSE